MCRILYRLHNCTLCTQEAIKMETSDVVMVIQLQLITFFKVNVIVIGQLEHNK